MSFLCSVLLEFVLKVAYLKSSLCFANALVFKITACVWLHFQFTEAGSPAQHSNRTCENVSESLDSFFSEYYFLYFIFL